MIKSMTGFAAVEQEDEQASVSVTLRSVNHRHLDLQLRLPPGLAPLEPRLRGLLQAVLVRGRVEMAVSVVAKRPAELSVELNEPYVAALAAALDAARARGLAIAPLTAGDLLRSPHALTVAESSAIDDEAREAHWTRISAAVTRAAGELEAMRRHEGEHLRQDLEARCATLLQLVDRVTTAAAEGRAALEARLLQRVHELAAEVDPDPGALAQELVRVAGRVDVSEELSRLRGHLDHWATLAAAPEACGRRLDFLLQEMNREVNTIGSKAEGPALSRLIVDAKAELEKLREQVQNVE